MIDERQRSHRARAWRVMMAIAAVACVTVFWTASATAHGAPSTSATDPAAVAITDQYRQMAPVPAAFAVVDEGSVSFGGQEGAGPETAFVIGSVSKSFTALAVLVAVERGQLSLDDAVDSHLPGLGLAWEGEPVRIRHLLTHTSGLDTTTCNLDMTTTYDTLAARVDDLRGRELSRPPGELFEYCNVGYAVLGRILEVTTGRSFDQVLRTNVLEPLSLTGTLTDIGDAPSGTFAEGRTTFLGVPIVRPETASPAALPDGYIVSTARDLATYAQFQMGDGTTASGERLVSTELLQEAHRPIAPVPPGGGMEAAYGFGWFVVDEGGQPVVWHGGTTYRYQADVAMIPSQGRAVISLAAGQWLAGTSPLTNATLAGVLAEPSAPTPLYPVATALMWMALLLLVVTVIVSLRRANVRRRTGRRPTIWSTSLLAIAAFAVPVAFFWPAYTQLGSFAGVLAWGREAAPDLLLIEMAWVCVLAWVAVRALIARRRPAQP